MSVPASAKQIDFIARLLRERDVQPEVAAAVEAVEVWSKDNASQMIGNLLAFPKRATAAPVALVPGFYTNGPEFFKVVASKSTGKPYAKRLIGRTWEYMPGGMNKAATWKPLTLEGAAAYGFATGYCLCCGRELTDPKSVAMGIGPVCANKF